MKHPKLLLWLTLASIVGSIDFAQAQTRDTPCSPDTAYNAVCLSWTAPTTRTDGTTYPTGTVFNYRVEKQNGATWTTISTATATTLLVPNLANGTHTFRVYAISPAGATSSASNTASRAIEAAPNAPVLIIAALIREGQPPVYRIVQRVRLKDGEVVFVAPESMRRLFASASGK